MDIRDYLQLLATAKDVTGAPSVGISIGPNGVGRVEVECGPGYAYHHFKSVVDLESVLVKLGTPPKPKTFAIVVPYNFAAWRAAIGSDVGIDWDLIDGQCKAAMAPWSSQPR